MKVIIAGSRTITDYQLIEQAVIASTFPISEVVSGCQVSTDPETGKHCGADYFGEQWAHRNGVPCARFPADWNMHGKAAGPIRNAAMADYAVALIAIWDGKSKGTRNMIDRANMRGLLVYVHRVN